MLNSRAKLLSNLVFGRLRSSYHLNIIMISNVNSVCAGKS